MTGPLNAAHWQGAADDVLSVLATEQYVTDGANHFNRAWHEQNAAAHHFPPGPWRALFDAIVKLHGTGRGVNWNTVADAADGQIEQRWFFEIQTLADPTRMGRTFDDNVKLLREYGETFAVIGQLETATRDLKNGANRDTEVDRLISILSQGSDGATRDTSAAGGAARLEAILSETARALVSTGVNWLDRATHGFLPAQLWYLSGPYKSSKTRIAYNMALSAAESGLPVAILSRENQEPVIAAQLVSMFAARYLIEKGVPYDTTRQVWWISPTGLLMARRNYLNWEPPVRVEAVRAGLKAYAALGDRLHIYDSTPDGGKLTDMTSIRRAVGRHKRLYGKSEDGELSAVYFCDHLGLIKRDGSVYEKTAATSNEFQELSRADSQHPITLVVLAQQSEAVVNASDDAYGSNVKGAGEPSADADVLLTTKPVKVDGKFASDRTLLTVKLNRYGPSGESQNVPFHPDSGLILPEKVQGIVRMGA